MATASTCTTEPKSCEYEHDRPGSVRRNGSQDKCLAQGIAKALGLDRHGADEVLRAVLHSLRDRLFINEAAQLGDQLPMLVRGIYYEAWHPAGKPEKIRSREEFLAKTATHTAMKQSINPERAARAVFQTIEHHVSPRFAM